MKMDRFSAIGDVWEYKQKQKEDQVFYSKMSDYAGSFAIPPTTNK
jgi:hypothetical protein